jgi:hypothetical protein
MKQNPSTPHLTHATGAPVHWDHRVDDDHYQQPGVGCHADY